MSGKVAIVLAAFGVSVPRALGGIGNIVEKARAAFDCPVELSFTSNQVRRRWQQRLADPAWLAENRAPDFVQGIKSPLAAMTLLHDRGYKTQIVQPLHVYAGEEYHDLANCVTALAGIRTIKEKWRPFHELALGRPALGAPGARRPYLEDIRRAAAALEADAALARQMGAALVYVGHGNHVYSTGVYHELQTLLEERHPDLAVEIGVVEGIFGAEHVARRLKHRNASRVLLKPLMVVAGVHAADDMAGDEDDSWRRVLERAGLEVHCRLEGLGQNDAWAGIYLEHIAEAAQDAGIEVPGGAGPESGR